MTLLNKQEEKQNVAVFGGSFNPPHIAHVFAACAALSLYGMDKVLVVPTFKHPFDKKLESFEHRFKMCKLAFSSLEHVEVSRIEEELGGESLTYRLLEHVQRVHPKWSLRLLVGEDILREAHKWFRWDELVKIAPPLVLARKGELRGEAANKNTESDPYFGLLPDISSSILREKLQKNDFVSAQKALPLQVFHYMKDNALYAPSEVMSGE